MAGGVSFMGGKLNLKGDKKKAKKKSKKSKHSKKDKQTESSSSSHAKIEKDMQDPEEHEDNDGLTEAERKSLRFKSANEKRDFEKLGEKSHRERIEEFNAHLGSLTELNDIPRVSSVVSVCIFVILFSKVK